MKTKLLLTISIICLLVASTQAAIPYEYFPNRSEADGETPGAKIPNCIHQRGFNCYACGPDTEQEPAVPLFPNALNQCIPNPTGSGCNRFLDIAGNVCDVKQGCNCKFVIDSKGSTCVTSTIPNCFMLAKDGTCAQCIGLGRTTASYVDKNGFTQTLAQKTPVGGGISDYGRSADGKSCVDNLANANPNCLEYLNATSCNVCDVNYNLVQTGTPSASVRKCVKFPAVITINNCFVLTNDGKNCYTCNANFVLNQSGACVGINTENFLPASTPANRYPENCLRYEKGPDGKDNTSRCLKCVNFSFQLRDGSCSDILTNQDQEVNFITGEIADNQGGFCRLFYDSQYVVDQTTPGGQLTFRYCLVKKAANDYYIYQAPAAVLAERNDLKCQTYEWTSGKCLTCVSGYYLNTVNGSCNDASGSCSLTGCKTSNGYAYCTECLRGYNLVDGTCVVNNFADSNTVARCKTVTNGECTECDPEYYLDLKDSLSGNSSTRKNTCIYIDATGSECATWVAGKCTACLKPGQVIVDGLCKWAPDATFGGVPGCATHSADGICDTPYPYAFLSKDKKFTRILYKECPPADISGGNCDVEVDNKECASYDEDGNCSSVININYILDFDYPSGLFVSRPKGSGGYCDKSYDGGCTCVTCKNTWTLSSTKTCPPNYDSSSGTAVAILPNNLIRGCIEFLTATTTGGTCKQCRSPDFISTPTTDGLCYDLTFQRKVSTLVGWKSLFIRIDDSTAGKTGGPLLANQAVTTDYNPTFDFAGKINYEACTAASSLNTCTTCFSGRPNNIISVTLSATDASYFASAITYCHDNTDTYFTSAVLQKSVLVRDGLVTTVRDTSALQLDRVKGCTVYTSLVLGTCATCASDYTKSTDSTKCLKKNGDVIDGVNANGCGTIDPTDGQCLTCPDTQAYIYNTTDKTCTQIDGSAYSQCLTQDLTTGKCLTCIPSHVLQASTSTPVCESVLNTSGLGCSGACSVGTATYVAAVVSPAASEYLQAATCGKGYTLDSNKRCIRNKTDWTTSVADIDGTGNFLTCNSGYTLFKTSAFALCIPTIANCKTHDFSNNEVTCTTCAVDANGMPYIRANAGKLCIPAQNFLPNCQTFNSSGTGCLVCKTNYENLESQGCNRPPNCTGTDPNSLLCISCATNFILTAQGDCIMPLPGKWATDANNCKRAFNATHCAECKAVTNVILTIDDSDNDNQYGVGECVNLAGKCVEIDGCELVLRDKDSLNCQLTTYQCIRCQIGYSMFGGQCYNNQQGTNQLFPNECVNVEYDEDQKAYLCTECDFGFAITTDRRQCIPNYGPCSYLDSTDCASYDLAQGHEEVQIECASDRESNSIIISASLMIILNIILLVI